jgi:hypothetical protein
MKKNFINLIDPDYDIPLYRVFKIEHLLQVFTTGKLTLVKPSRWDDPFENFLMKAEANLKRQGVDSNIHHYRDEYYGQCWTTNGKENDALWRIYSPDKNGVRVKVPLENLGKSFFNYHSQNCRESCFLGKVAYLRQRELLEMITNKNDNLDKDKMPLKQARSLFVKRKEFEHENEFRLVYHHKLTNNEDLYKFDFDPLEHFSQLVFDPRMDENCYSAFKDFLVKLKYPSGLITKSKLYQFPINPAKLLESQNRFYQTAVINKADIKI